ncbi:ribonuclease H-like domain-containing protein [Jimgerdemannia flammicorona]|uniref:Ribonuclease H-like domain-containing protein n=1 Tax=Jimgerdemannia flammicorona TaxID=994334 RepID=A0A433DA84_9FUNG|nr:ribonuclease H-like domain-containing protein [Jimgerdemannia flammicorona]
MEVLKDNFEEVLPIFTAAVENADFIAIDTELTGLNRPTESQDFTDDTQTRYSKLRISASEFLVIQFGVCTFTWSDTQGVFVAKPFNFYVFPSGEPRMAGDRCFTCNSSSMKFLSGCNFDFNKLIRGGIPYMTHTEEEKYHELRELRTGKVIGTL